MSIRIRRRATLAALLSAAVLAPAAAAGADAGAPDPDRCEARYERLLDRFHDIEERRGWYEAFEWWNDRGWPRYYDRCLDPQG